MLRAPVRSPQRTAWLRNVTEDKWVPSCSPSSVPAPASGDWGRLQEQGTFVGCYRPEDVLGKGFSVIFPEEQRLSVEAQYQDVFRGEVQPFRPVDSSVVAST